MVGIFRAYLVISIADNADGVRHEADIGGIARVKGEAVRCEWYLSQCAHRAHEELAEDEDDREEFNKGIGRQYLVVPEEGAPEIRPEDKHAVQRR